MTDTIPISIAVEGLLDETVVRALLGASGRPYAVGECHGRKGKPYLRSKIAGFNSAARFAPFFVLIDLNGEECAPRLRDEWLRDPKDNNLIFRIAVREVESWLMADRDPLSRFLGISKSRIPRDPDGIDNPKERLLQLAGGSPKRNIREALIPRAGSLAKVGPDYNGVLSRFVRDNWQVERAAKNSPSLERALSALRNFNYVPYRGL